jgi:hypothetical protein
MAWRDELLVEIAREEFRLVALEQSSASLMALRNEFVAKPSVQIVIPPTSASVIATVPMRHTTLQGSALLIPEWRGFWKRLRMRLFRLCPNCAQTGIESSQKHPNIKSVNH